MYLRKPVLLNFTDERVQIDWQWPLYGAYSKKMVKSAQSGDGGGGARPPPFTLSTITSKVVLYDPAMRAETAHSSYFASVILLVQIICGA